MTLSEYLAKYRAEHGNISQRELAKQCGVSNGYIAMLERGYAPASGEPVTPSMKIMRKLAEGMRVDLDELLRSLDGDTVIGLGGTLPPDDAYFDRLSNAEQKLVSNYRALTPAWRQVINSTIENALKKE